MGKAERESAKPLETQSESQSSVMSPPVDPGQGKREAYTPMPSSVAERKRPRWWIAAVSALVATGLTLAIALAPKRGKVEFPVSSVDLNVAATAAARQMLSAGQVPKELESVPEEMRREIAAGVRSLYSFQVVDTVEEDGDVVRVNIDGRDIGFVQLGHAGTTFTLPLKDAANAQLTITAEQDGGGGVTFGAISSRGQVVEEVMGIGEVRSWTIYFK